MVCSSAYIQTHLGVVLGGTGVQRNIADGDEGIVDIHTGADGVSLSDLILALPQGLGHIVDLILGEGIGNDVGGGNTDSGDGGIGGDARVLIMGDGHLGVNGIVAYLVIGDELIHYGVIQAQQVDIHGGLQLGDGGGGSTGGEEEDIQLAILHGIGAVIDGKVLYGDIIGGNTVGGKQGFGVGLGAGAGITDGNAQALDIGQGLDGVLQVAADNDLHDLGVNLAQNREGGDGNREIEVIQFIVGFDHGIVLYDGHIVVAVFDAIDIGNGAACGNDIVGVAGGVLQDHADGIGIGIVGAGGAAGANGDGSGGIGGGIGGVIAAAAGNTAQQHHGGHQEGE